MVDASVLVREYLLGQSEVTALLGTNANNSIYCAYDLPEHFDPTLGPAIQLFRAGGHSHEEITPLLDARIQIRVWSDVERYSTAAAVYAAINDVLHGATGQTVTDGTIVRALEADGPLEMTDPETGWIAIYAFYTVMARPAGSSAPSVYTPKFYEGTGAPASLFNSGDVYYDTASGNLYEQAGSAWVLIGNIPTGGSSEMPSLIYHKVAAASTNAANIKAASGTVTGWKIYNDTEYPIYVKLYDKASAPVPGTDTPKQTVGVDAGMGEVVTSAGYSYVTGIGIAITKGILDSDSTPVAAGDCVVDIFYQ